MRIGVATPIVTAHPATSRPWETTAGPDDLRRIARAADDLGYDHLGCSEHVAVPVAAGTERGTVYFDPVATLSHLAATTTRIRLATLVVVLGYHHPLEIAKRYGTLDVLSGGRVVLGVGVGSLREEFDLLGAEFAGRGDRADDALRALHASFGTPRPRYDGTHYSFADMEVRPHSAGAVPIWVGGRTLRSLRRAVDLGNGWVPFALSADETSTLLAKVETPPDFEVVLSCTVDPVREPDRTRTALDRLRDTGATVAKTSVIADDPAGFVDALVALRELAEPMGIAFAPAGGEVPPASRTTASRASDPRTEGAPA
ncbi:TIGR03619 family F420-dependent LLM class oxidoreductase [Rhodococcus rhodnii]|uniref:Luciferase-like domain-containing protein n=2 Tax=Rhodococcus rhodnii TaxID=38312 RepID=R7WQ75_9NOCA|nr:TIGR03619 family F420-dependent LLM class oxidoreductase [Rhodococcus rhodnii]EOM77471.1 hypothetical protein Rrhod_1148 [Rhodococcus rhodnii LMG 5362]TXG90346.1 TIGR03619 family F420-dependent LLM class oxidoreductase [Rhodococcus rhodnii]